MNPSHPFSDLLLNMTRRELFKRSGVALGAAALEWLLAGGAGAAEAKPGLVNPLAPKPPHFPARAKRVIYMHMVGAPSQIDLFEHKPALDKYDGKPCPEEFIKGKRFAFLRGHPNIAASRYSFKRHGQSGAEVSELLPWMASVADEFAVVKTVHTEEFNHAPAQLFLHAGFGRPGRPSLGAWVTYGLCSESQSLPANVVLLSGPLGGAGTSLWSTGFLPSVYQGVQFRSGGDPVLFLSSPKGHTQQDRRRLIDTIAQLNQAQLAEVGDPEIATGYNIVEKPVHVHDLNATMLHLLGLDHERLTYRYQGRAFRLTDVQGKVVNEIVG